MKEEKKHIFSEVDQYGEVLTTLADDIYDHPEIGLEEYHAVEVLTNFLKEEGFSVEVGIGGLPTAFRAEWINGNGGSSIGFLCEYDAIEDFGHACAHHMQGPACVGAAAALKRTLTEQSYKIVVYGTPAEEVYGGKIHMLQEGCFQDIDVALMMHGGPDTCIDIKSLAMNEVDVTFIGKAAHAAIAPEQGRSALDAMLLSFNGIEFLREHVKDDVRIHYTILESPGPTNVVHDRATGCYCLRSESREDLNEVMFRFKDIIKGAALMAGVQYEMNEKSSYDNKIPAMRLNQCVMENAEACGAPGIAPARKKTGSTDFANVVHRMPGTCARVKFVPEGTSSHTQKFLDEGKSESGHEAVILGAKILAGTAQDLICQEGLLDEIWREFRERTSERSSKNESV